MTVENLLPHRGRMLLVGEILILNEKQATTLSIAGRDWPLCRRGAISPLILVELVAQTSGVHNGLERLKTRGTESTARGWLVGVKNAHFHVHAITPGEAITTTVKNTFVFDNLREIDGRVTIGGRPAAEVTLQVIEAD